MYRKLHEAELTNTPDRRSGDRVNWTRHGAQTERKCCRISTA
jgi:hypothetical protein